MMLDSLKRKIDRREARVGVIGLGYVGLPVAAVLARAGFPVTGVDIREERVATIMAGRSPISGEEPGLDQLIATVVAGGQLKATTDYALLRDADLVLINVETPVDDTGTPRYAALRSACTSLGAVLRRGALVIVESTIAPGTIDRVVAPLLSQATGCELNVDFFLGACPERVMPGRLLANLSQMSRVCGGSTPAVAEVMVHFYRHIVAAELDPADPVTAEVVKTAENAYRDVQIAFANEVALICEAVGADVWRVRELVNKSPSRQMHLPGAGVGGHCIPKDGLLLAYGAAGQAPVRLIPAARAVNDSMPGHMLALLEDALAAVGQTLTGSRVAVLGYSYLEESDDIRNSPSAALVAALKAREAGVAIHDPWVAAYQGDLWSRLTGCDAALLMVRHRAYLDLDLAALAGALRRPVLIDGRGVFERRSAEAAGLIYRGIGQGRATGASNGR